MVESKKYKIIKGNRHYYKQCLYCKKYNWLRNKFCCREHFFQHRLENRKLYILTQEQRNKIRESALIKNCMSKPENELGWHGKYNRVYRKKNPDYYRNYNKKRFVYET